MWNAITYVSSGVTLVAFVVAVVATLIRRHGLRQKELIESAPESERSSLIDKTLEFFNVDTGELTKQQKYDLARQQIQAKADRFRITAMIVAVVAVLSAGVLIVALIVAPSPSPAAINGSDDDLYDEFASYLRKQVQLSKPDEEETNASHLGISIVDFSRDGDTLFAELKRVGGYQTPWKKDEAEQALRDRANDLRDDHPSDEIRDLKDIKVARVTNLVAVSGNLRESLLNSVDQPSLREIYEARQQPPARSQYANEIRYFIESLPNVETAEAIVADAFQKWAPAIPIVITRADTRAEANLVVSTEMLTGQGYLTPESNIGPPTTYDQLNIVLNGSKTWEPQLLSHIVCHQFGHTLGLRHTQTPGQLMSPIIQLELNGPQVEDLERAQAIWGVPSST